MASESRCGFELDAAERADASDLDARDYSYAEFDPFGNLRTDADGHWRCPRTATEPDDRCRFHSDATSDDELAAEIRRAFEAEPDPTDFAEPLSDQELKRLSKVFVGVDAAALSFSNERLDAPDAYPLDLRCSEIDRLDLRSATLGHGIRCDGLDGSAVDARGASVGGDARFDLADVDGDVRWDDARVDGELSGVDSAVGGTVGLESAAVEGGFDFSYAEVGGVDAANASVRDRFRLKNAGLAGSLDCEGFELTSSATERDVSAYTLRGASVDGWVSLRKASVEGTCLCNELRVAADFDLSDAEVESHLWMGGVNNDVAELGPATVGGSLDLTGATVGGVFDSTASDDGRYAGTTVGGAVHAASATFEGSLVAGPRLERPEINVVNLRGATVASGSLTQPADGHLVYDLADATVGDVSIDPIRDDPAGHVRFLNTTFDGFRFGDRRRLYSKIGWEIHGIAPEYEDDLRATCELRTAERLARDFAVVVAAAPAVRDAVAGTEPPYDLERVARALFDGASGVRDGGAVAHVARHGPENFFHPAIGEREAYRQGVVTHLAEWLDAGGRNRTTAVLEDEGCATRVRRLAARVAETDRSPDRALADPAILERATEAALAFAALFRREAMDSGDDSPYLPDDPRLAPTHAEREVTYLLARNGAADAGDRIASAEFFIKELEYRRKQHWRTARGAGERTTARRRLSALYDWASNLLLYLAAGYGERPRRVFVVSVATVFLFAGVYGGLSSVSVAFSRNALLFSLQSFIAFVVGTPPAQSFAVRVVSAVEGFAGAFLIALFVFTLTRSLDR